MSSSNNGKNSNGTNGSITLKSFAELANVLDLESLPPGLSDVDDNTDTTGQTDVALDNTSADTQSRLDVAEQPPAARHSDLASLIAQLATVSSGLETMAREDARAREQATIELAQYETLAARTQRS